MGTPTSGDRLANGIERATSKFVHIPGPNPLLRPGARGSWDDGVIESCDVIKDHDTYYWYYHGTSSSTGYQVGVATAPHPLGPWTKSQASPVLRLGPEGSWEDRHVACAAILKEGVERYYMWYSGKSAEKGGRWHIGLATGSSPLGPWEKHDANPVLEDFGYVGGVLRAKGKYHLYTEHPIGSTGDDYGPLSLATADSPEGPWVKHEEPVLRQGEWGEWDDGGFSEAKVFYRSGIFHLFYGGAKLNPTRILSRESIGYAYSFDGTNFTKHIANPVAPREANPDGAAFAEVHSYAEPPFIYLYHTLRYNSRDGDEDLGAQVLATSRPFALPMPVLSVASLAAAQATALDACPPISLGPVATCALTAECTFDPHARAGAKVHIRSSYDGLHWDTENLRALELPCRPGETVRKTFEFGATVMFVKLLIENLDGSSPLRDVRVDATLCG